MRIALALAVLALVPASAAAQSDPTWSTGLPTTLAADKYTAMTVTASGRVAFFSGGEALDDGPGWKDIFQEGMGAALEISQTTGVLERYGWFVSFAAELYEGDKANLNATTTIEPDEMQVGLLTLGVKADGDVDWLYWSARVGVGGAYYNDVDADQVTGAVTTEVELYKRSPAWLGEVGVRFGLKFGGMVLVIGGSYRYQGPPKTGDDFDTKHSEVLNVLAADAGIVIRF